MAVASSSSILSLFSMNLSSSYPNLPLVSVSSRPNNWPRSPVIVFSYKSGNGLASEEKKLLLERYGLNPDEFLSEPSPPKKKGRKEVQKGGRRKSVEPPEEPNPPRTTHKLLQVLGGKARRKKLLSPKGMDVRPMMEVVKGAAFDILQVASGCPASLRPGRWLDLYSGTGSVGIEAISRGCSEVHFVEMDPWVVSDVLRPNLEWTGFLDVSVIHTVRVENFFERAERFVGKDGSFDYISVTPPYTEVDYGVLMGQISNSPLIGEDTFIVVEYPSRTNMLDTCGCLVKITDRRFGRTHLVIYGPTWAQKKRKLEKSLRKSALEG
ncbi:putative rRNA methyltransferase YlbH [Morella rubra]|uniref:Putative rRNA methyltransferase YlbH n=1 Tax=Morella rubra TaxID=262757 RepID=A0A6A1VFG0_9ROSI|nr:putative rRNA methyltransferase YlbH [Morella rubra]